MVIVGDGFTVKVPALVAVPPAVVTVMVPVVANVGEVAVICVFESTVNAAATPLNCTAEAAVKLVPVITTGTSIPAQVEAGVKLVIVGAKIVILTGVATTEQGETVFRAVAV